MNALKECLQSFYSRELYFNLAHARKGIGMSFILFLTACMMLCVLISFISAYPQTSQMVQQLAAVTDTLPAAIYKDGALSIDKPVPYTITLGPDFDKLSVVVDTGYKGDLESLGEYMKKNNIVMLVTSNKLITLKDKNGQLEVSDLGSQPFAMSHVQWHKISQIMLDWWLVIILAGIVIGVSVGSLAYNLLAAFVAGIVVKVLGLIITADFDYMASVRIAAAMRIPVALITMAPSLIGLTCNVLVGWLIWIAYLLFATFATKRKHAA